MKRILIAVSLMLSTGAYLHAQTSAGSKMLGGSLEYYSRSGESGSFSDYSGISFAPAFGYFVKDNLVVGAALAIGSERTGTGAGKTTGSFFGLGPFVRAYKFTSNDKFAFFGEAGLSFAFGKTDPANGNVTNYNELAFNVSPGMAYFFNEHWGMEMTLTGFVVRGTDPNKDRPDDKYTRVDLGISSFSPQLGLWYFF